MRKKTGWFKPYILNHHNIEAVVPPAAPGTYMLANLGTDRRIKIKKIKSSADIKQDLFRHVGEFPLFLYKPFKYQLENYLSQSREVVEQA